MIEIFFLLTMLVFFVLSTYYYSKYVDYLQKNIPKLYWQIFSKKTSLFGKLMGMDNKQMNPYGLKLMYLDDKQDDGQSIKYKKKFRLCVLLSGISLLMGFLTF